VTFVENRGFQGEVHGIFMKPDLLLEVDEVDDTSIIS
jgi:hypothetical protein